MRSRAAGIGLLIALALSTSGCDDGPTGLEGPFSLRIAVEAGEAARAVLDPGEEIELRVGETLVLEVQVLDGRGAAASVQAQTVGETSHPAVLEGLGAVLDRDRNLARFVFVARAEGVSAVGFENAPAELGTVIIVRVAGAP